MKRKNRRRRNKKPRLLKRIPLIVDRWNRRHEKLKSKSKNRMEIWFFLGFLQQKEGRCK